jgi:diguanylate cyclase (GGDEF)-like protein
MPVSLGLIWLIQRLPPRRIEHCLLVGILNAYVVPIFLFWRTREAIGLYTFGDLSLVIFFANLVLPLRFRHAALFTASAFSATVFAVAVKAQIEPALKICFSMQIATTCVFALYANYLIERRRCLDYLVRLKASLEAEAAEQASRRMRDLSQLDALTELPNRRYLDERLEAWLAEGNAVALLIVDIDHFKLYNDTLGHLAGDECLKRVARVFAAASQNPDVFCARYGGEEFVFAMRCVTRLQAVRFARALLASVDMLAIPHPALPSGRGVLTISLGLALRSARIPMTAAKLLSAADQALYLAKSRGRGQFAIAKFAGYPTVGDELRQSDAASTLKRA